MEVYYYNLIVLKTKTKLREKSIIISNNKNMFKSLILAIFGLILSASSQDLCASPNELCGLPEEGQKVCCSGSHCVWSSDSPPGAPGNCFKNIVCVTEGGSCGKRNEEDFLCCEGSQCLYPNKDLNVEGKCQKIKSLGDRCANDGESCNIYISCCLGKCLYDSHSEGAWGHCRSDLGETCVGSGKTCGPNLSCCFGKCVLNEYSEGIWGTCWDTA